MRTFRIALACVATIGLIAGCGGAASSDSSPAESSSERPQTENDIPGTKDWRVSRAQWGAVGAEAQIEGYAGQNSVLPGEDVALHVSTGAREYDVEVYRLGWYGGKGGRLVAQEQGLPGTKQTATATDPDTGAVRADWQPSTTLATDDWPAGFYAIKLVATSPQSARPVAVTIPLVVRSADTEGTVMVVAGDTTWQAYNLWGGRNLYQEVGGTFDGRSRAVSFDRPYMDSGFRWPARFDVPIVQQAERVSWRDGVRLSYASVTSITEDPSSTDGVAGIISNGHDEYWTAPYRNALVRVRDAGANLAFLGANAGYWQVRLSDDGRALLGDKGGRDQRWRDVGKGENEVVGQLYDCFPADAPLRIRQPDFFLFEGTGVSKGDSFDNLVGSETDRVYDLPSTPRPVQVPALSPLTCRGAQTWSTMAYYTTDSGAGVFSSGTMNWTWALKGPAQSYGLDRRASQFARRVTGTLVREMAAGPMGQRHPASDDLEELGLPSTNTNGSA